MNRILSSGSLLPCGPVSSVGCGGLGAPAARPHLSTWPWWSRRSSMALTAATSARSLPQPQSVYDTIAAYRNAFTHDPVLGRAVDQGRELLPPQHWLPKTESSALERRRSHPDADMIDGLKLEEELWHSLRNSSSTMAVDDGRISCGAKAREVYRGPRPQRLLPIRLLPPTISRRTIRRIRNNRCPQ